MSPNGSHKRGESGDKVGSEGKSSDLTMLIVLAMICATILGVVFIIWG